MIANPSSAVSDNMVRQIILFDGVCNLCNGLIQFIIKKDTRKKFSFAPLQSEHGRKILQKAGLQENELQTIVYSDNGHYYVRSSAILHVLKDLGGFWQVFYIFILLPKSFRDRLYNLIANRRYRLFGRRPQCMLPSEAVKSRFLN